MKIFLKYCILKKSVIIYLVDYRVDFDHAVISNCKNMFLNRCSFSKQLKMLFLLKPDCLFI